MHAICQDTAKCTVLAWQPLMDVEQLNAALSFIPKPTAQLRRMLMERANSTELQEFESILDAVRSLFEKYTRILSDATPGKARALRLHSMIDQAMEATKSFPVSCGKGCGGCCHFAVEITGDEAELLHALLEEGVEIDFARLGRQATLGRDSAAWKIPWSVETRCVFLDTDSTCRIYAHRPVACRKLVVTTPAKLCASSSSMIDPIGVLTVEIIVSAAISLSGYRQGLLSKMLLESRSARQSNQANASASV